jgi:hypothetical protein
LTRSAEFGGLGKELKNLERSGNDWRSDTVRKEVGSRPLAEEIDDLLFA